jgi:hypothetical protein
VFQGNFCNAGLQLGRHGRQGLECRFQVILGCRHSSDSSCVCLLGAHDEIAVEIVAEGYGPATTVVEAEARYGRLGIDFKDFLFYFLSFAQYPRGTNLLVRWRIAVQKRQQ